MAKNPKVCFPIIATESEVATEINSRRAHHEHYQFVKLRICPAVMYPVQLAKFCLSKRASITIIILKTGKWIMHVTKRTNSNMVKRVSE